MANMYVFVGGIAIVVLLLVAMRDETRQRRKKATEFVAKRAPMADAEFVDSVSNATTNDGAIIAVRRAMAHLCEIQPEYLQPNEKLKFLWPLQFDGGDHLELMYVLKSDHQIEFDRNAYDAAFQPPPTTLGELATKLGAIAKPKKERLA